MVVYSSYYESFKHLADEDFSKCIKMVFEYGLYGIEPQEDGIVRAMFTLVKPQIDCNNQRWLNSLKTKKHSEAGEGDKGKEQANSKQASTKRSAKSKRAVSKPETNVYVYDNDNENENVNVNVNENEDVNENAYENAQVCVNANRKVNENVPTQSASSAEAVHMYGEYANIKMTEKEYEALKSELGFTRFSKCMEFFSRYLVRKPEHRSAKHFEDLRGWVLDAVKKDEPTGKSLRSDFYGSQWDIDLEDLFEKPIKNEEISS